MAVIMVLVRKEVSDAITSRTFLLAFGVLLLSMMLAGFTAGEAYRNMLYYGKDQLLIIQNLNPVIRVMGALVALTLGFNTIKRESSEGSLKVLLSYPIYRDQIILGKYLGGLLVLSTATAAAMGVSMAVCIQVAGFTPEPGTLLNYSTFVVLSIILLSGYLGLSILLSLAFKEAKTTLLFMFFLLGVFNSEVLYSYGLVLSNIAYGPSPRDFDIFTAIALNPQPGMLQQLMYGAPSANPQAQAMQEFFAGLSPAHGFTSTSLALMAKYRAILSGSVVNSLSWWDIVVNNFRSITALALIPIITFIGSYALFTRRDVT